MKKEFTHYGQKVLLAGNRSRYEMILEKKQRGIHPAAHPVQDVPGRKVQQ